MRFFHRMLRPPMEFPQTSFFYIKWCFLCIELQANGLWNNYRVYSPPGKCT